MACAGISAASDVSKMEGNVIIKDSPLHQSHPETTDDRSGSYVTGLLLCCCDIKNQKLTVQPLSPHITELVCIS